MINNEEWILTEMNDEYIVVPVGENSNRFKGVIKLNESGKDIWNGIIAGKDENSIADSLLETYEGLSREKALEDIRKLTNKLQEERLIKG